MAGTEGAQEQKGEQEGEGDEWNKDGGEVNSGYNRLKGSVLQSQAVLDERVASLMNKC